MNFEQSLVYELETISGLSNRVKPLQNEQDCNPPRVLYELTSSERLQTLQGHDGLIACSYDLDILHTDYANLKALMALIIAELKTFNFTTIGSSGVYVQQLFITNEYINESTDYESDNPIRHGVIEFEVHYQE